MSFDDKERPTGTICPCCSGEGKLLIEEGGRYRTKKCIYCTGGVCSAEQLQVWRNRSQR